MWTEPEKQQCRDDERGANGREDDEKNREEQRMPASGHSLRL